MHGMFLVQGSSIYGGRMIDITRGIEVGGFHFDVDMSDEAHKMLRGNNLSGECDHTQKIIRIDNDMAAVSISETFLHEVVEEINHIYCANSLNHGQIDQLGYGLHQVLESLGVRFGKDDLDRMGNMGK